MKKSYLKLVVAIVFASNLFAQNIPSYVPKDGLVGWWPFNGNANDESGNGNHGSVNGAVLTSDRNGLDNSAFQFSNSYIIIPNNTLFNSNNLSVSLWVSSSNVQRQIALIRLTYANANNEHFGIAFNDLTKYGVELAAKYNNPNCSPGNGWQKNEKVQNILDSKYHHIVGTIEGNIMKLYIDGIIVNTITVPYIQTASCWNGDIQIGRNWASFPDYFIGKIDDIGIYNRALTQEEITALFTSTPPCTTPSAKIAPQGNTTFCQGGFVNLNASTGANYTYEWYNNGQLINGVTASVYQAITSGNYTVKVINGACNATSTATTVTVNPNPIAKITPDGPTAFCEGGTVNLVASGGTTYKWNSGILTPSIKVTQTGTYYVNVINSFGCSVNKSYDVNVYPNPKVVITPIPQFILHNNGSIKLTATPAGGAFKGEGVTGTSFNPSNIGLGKKTLYYNYTSTQGCSGSAQLQTIVVDSIGTKCTSYDTVTITKTINDTVGILKIKFQLTTGIKANQFTSVSVYPNPTSDVLIIDASDVQALNGYRYKMIDISGKTVYNELVRTSKTEISLKTFGKAGVYILHVVDANNTSIETRQIVLE